jgi:3'-phosphoadenosine 5'-phosphosulfate sulfotransferase (PAPS reductase)/FAD synthetase
MESENAYTRKDLSVMQAWPLERKIRVTQTRIIEWYSRYGGNVAVSFSVGLDSTVLLDLVRRIFPGVRAAFVSTGLEYPEILSFVKSVPNVTLLRPEMPFREVIEKCGYPVISKEVARRIRYARRGSPWALRHLQGLNGDGSPSEYNRRYMKWAHLVDAPFPISDQCCEISKERPLRRFAKETGAAALVGTLACESMRRQSAYLRTGCNAFRKREPKSQPIAFWRKEDILRYLKLTGIPYASVYGGIGADAKTGRLFTTDAERTGCMYCMFGLHLKKRPNRFLRMAAEHPKHYDYCVNRLGCGAVLDYLGIPYRPEGKGDSP